jgi:LacI family transcriptional regulator
MYATIADVAHAASVSPGTVSNVLNRPERVRTETRMRVQRAIDLLGYRPNRHARMLAGGRDRGIGIVVHDAGNPFFARLADAVAETAEARGFSVVMSSSRADESRQEAALRLLLEHQLSGILLTPGVRPPRLTELAAGTPVVLLDYPGDKSQCSVRSDDVLGGRLAGQHLIDLGCRRLAFVGGPRRVRQHRDRAAGMRHAMRTTSGVEPLKIISVAEDTVTEGLAATAEVAAQIDTIDGLLCGNDLLAFGLIKGLADQGIRVPDDIKIIGFDDIDLAAFISVPLTTVHQPIALMGEAATELLLDEILNPDHRHRQRAFKPQLVVRASAG